MFGISALLVMGAVVCLPARLQAQSPMPENRVPGFGGTEVPDPLPPPGTAPSIAESPPPLIGASRPLPLSKSSR